MKTPTSLADSKTEDTDNVSVTLEVIRGRAKFRMRPVKGPTFLIGSGHQCDLVLGDTHFPEVHASIVVSPQRVRIQHIGPGPYVRVDSEIIRDSILQHGQTIDMGPYQFRIHIAFPGAMATKMQLRHDGPHTSAKKHLDTPKTATSNHVVPKPHVFSDLVGPWQSVTLGEEVIVRPQRSSE